MARTRLCSILALVPLAATARAQDVTLHGTCQTLVIADQDLSASCRDSLLKLVSPTFASFVFSTADSRTLSFTGGGSKDAGDAGDLPITLVAPGLTTKEGISRSPTPGTGTCRVATPEPGSTSVACEASAQGKRYAGTFVARGKP